MNNINDKILKEMLKEDNNLNFYKLHLADDLDKNLTDKEFLTYVKNSESIIKSEANRILIYTLLDTDFNNKVYNTDLDEFFYKYYTSFYRSIELIIRDYYLLLYQNSFKELKHMLSFL